MAKTATIPVPTSNYDLHDQIVSRRTTEQLLQEAFNDSEDDRLKRNKESSLAIRRFQFLLMGAGNG